jgi:hypothetical protein
MMTKKWKLIRKIKKIKNFFYGMFVMVMTLPVWANLPTPPPEDQAVGSQDWIDVGGSMLYRTAKYACILMGAVIFIAAAANIVKAYHTAHDKQDLSHFFKHLIVGLVSAAIGVGLLYAGYTIITGQG